MTTVVATGATSAVCSTRRGRNVVIGAVLSTNVTERPPLDVARSVTPASGVAWHSTCIGVDAVAGGPALRGLADDATRTDCPPACLCSSIVPSGATRNEYPDEKS